MRKLANEYKVDLENIKLALEEAAIVSITNLMGKIIYANDYFLEVSGYSKEEILNQNHRVIKSDKHGKDFFIDLWKTISSGKVWRGEICNRRKNGEYYWVDSTIVPFLDEKGKPYQYMGIRFLITDKKKYQSRLAQINQNQEKIIRRKTEELKKSNILLMQSEKMASLGALVAGIAHEINTPIGIGVTAASNLQESVEDLVSKASSQKMTRQDLREFMEDANESSDILLKNLEKAAALIRSFKQVATDQSAEDKRVFFFKEYLNEILLSLKPELKKTKLRVIIDCSEELQIDHYAGVFSQIISNFITNSIRYAFNEGEEGNIKISFTKSGNYGLLMYEDNGKGMDLKTKHKIFDPFFTTGRSIGGTGLGMHVVFNLVTQKLLGDITCTSETDKGTKFEINFPLSQ